MSKEKNWKNLNTALKQLPEQPVRDELWDTIEQRLLLQDSLQALPKHAPDEIIWKGIEEQLDKSGRIYRILRSAAALLVLGISAWWLFTTTPTKSKVSYSQETIEQQWLVTDWKEEDGTIDQFNLICQQQPFSCATPSFQLLQNELKDLEVAKQELVQAIQIYGKDAALIGQLKTLEIERSSLMRDMYQALL